MGKEKKEKRSLGSRPRPDIRLRPERSVRTFRTTACMENSYYGELSVVGMPGCEAFVEKVDNYLHPWRGSRGSQSYIVEPECKRFGTGEGKAVLHESLRGRDVYIIADMYNYGVTYKMYGTAYPMSPDDHFADLKRVINAIAGKARRITVIMPMLYESRQDKRHVRESLDCAVALQELENMGVTNIVTFDVHNIGIQNAVPLIGFDNVQCTYQMIKALVKKIPDIELDKDHVMVISPDEGGMTRCMYYSSLLSLDLGMFYKRRDYTLVVNGKNPIVAHEYLGRSVKGKDVIIVDDIISSGQSVLDVASNLKERGAKRIFAFATFGLFNEGLETIDKAYADGVFNRIFTTNLIYRSPELLKREWYTEVDLTKYVALIVDTLNRDETISHLLKPAERIQALMARVKDGKSEKTEEAPKA